MKIIYTALVALALAFGTTAFASNSDKANSGSKIDESSLERLCMRPIDTDGDLCVPIKKPKKCPSKFWTYLKKNMVGTTRCQPSKCSSNMKRTDCNDQKRCQWMAEGTPGKGYCSDKGMDG